MPIEYTSTGTIRMRLQANSGTSITKVFFAPDRDHSVQHDDRPYVVFMPCSGDSTTAYVANYDQKKGYEIPITSPSLKLQFAVSHAAANQCKVEIYIELKNGDSTTKNEVNLAAIVIPAK